jgi:hypothetical protein
MGSLMFSVLVAHGQADVIAKLEVKICQHKDQLWWFWKNEDMDNTGLV